eukprot:IDg18431t1
MLVNNTKKQELLKTQRYHFENLAGVRSALVPRLTLPAVARVQALQRVKVNLLVFHIVLHRQEYHKKDSLRGQ